MKLKILFLFLVFIYSEVGFSYNLEIMPALSVRQYDGEKTESGFGFHSHWTFYKGSKGYFLNVFYRGSVIAPDVIFGYGVRSSGKTFYELGGGARYSPIGGIGIGLLASIGVNLSGKTYLTLPFVYRSGGLGGITYIPHIGFRF